MEVNGHKLVSKHVRKISGVLLTVMLCELLYPLKALALTSGPSQPEFQGFTPLATTSLVDPFSGDFSYNIPLLDIDGYPLNLVYRATSNIEEEGSWVGYGWNVNVGTLNRMVRGLPDDMDGEELKSYQNIRERNVYSTTLGVEAGVSLNAGFKVGQAGVGVTAGVNANASFTKDDDDYTGKAIGVSIGGGVYAAANVGPFNATANAGVTLSANSSAGGSITPYAGFNVGVSHGEYLSVGFGKSWNRTFNTISGWGNPTVIGSYNIASVTREIQKNFINSVSNDIPQFTNPYIYTSDGTAYKLKISVSIGLLEGLGIEFGAGVTYAQNHGVTKYPQPNSIRKGYGYMYADKATPTDVLDFTRDNDGGLNKDLPFMPPAMKTFDVFSSTAHNATNVFRADRNDFGSVRDPRIEFPSSDLKNKTHQVTIKFHSSLTCWVGITGRYDNIKTATEGFAASGGCADDLQAYRTSNGKDQNVYFKACGATAQADDSYLSQVNNDKPYSFNKANNIKGIADKKRPVLPEPIAVYTNGNIAEYPQTVIPKKLESYQRDTFPTNKATKRLIDRAGASKIGAILNTNKAGQTYVYATPVDNNIKNEVAFRISGFNTGNPNIVHDNIYDEANGLMTFSGEGSYISNNGPDRDKLYKNTVSPAYATSYLLNAVLSPDYVDVQNDGISDDDLGSFVKFNYTRTDSDYRWRVPYGDKDTNLALLNQGVKVTKFDNTASYIAGSKQMWYAHSMESKNYVVEFYTSDRKDALDSRGQVIYGSHPFSNSPGISPYKDPKNSFAHMQKLDSIRYFYKHDRYLNQASAVPLKTIYFDYDYGISGNLPNSEDTVTHGKLRLLKVMVRHGSEPKEFAETYNLGYTPYNPLYRLGDKDGWGNYCDNNSEDHPIPLCEFPYINQEKRDNKDRDASVFHVNSIGLPSGGKIDIEYEADDYAYVQNKRAMALTQVQGIGASPNYVGTDVSGLYDNGLNPYLYIYVKNPGDIYSGYKDFYLNGSNLMYFSFNINIAGNAFSTFDQVKGYAQVEDIGPCYNDNHYLFIKVKPIDLIGTNVKPSPMTNTAINMARAFATDQLYFQEPEQPSGKNQNQLARLQKAALQVGDALLGKNSIKELMKDYRAGHKFQKNKSFVKLTLTKPKIGGGSRVSKLTFDDEWSTMIGESTSLIGYKYIYKDNNGMSSGVASYEPTLGGEENPLRSGHSYSLSSNPSKYPPYDPIEMIKEDPVGESFFPTGSVGYSQVTIESIHKGYARSALSRLVQQFYTAKDFPFFSSFGPKDASDVPDKDYPNPGVRDIMLSFLGISNTISSSKNTYDVKQDFVIETNDMHGKPKATYNYRLLLKNAKEELVSSTEYYYHTSGNKLANEVDVIQYKSLGGPPNAWPNCKMVDTSFPKNNAVVPPTVQKKTLGVDVDVCTDSREVVCTETRKISQRGGGVKVCIPPQIYPQFTWTDDEHKHTDYFKSTTTTKIVNKYGILKSVRNYKEGAETIVENKYYDAVTGNPVVQIVKDKYGDNIYSTNVPAYWTRTDLEPSYLDYPYLGSGAETLIPNNELTFGAAGTSGDGFLTGSGLTQASFTTGEDVFHQGDELFVYSGSTNSSDQSVKWRRLYVADVLVKKDHYSEPDPLSMRYGSETSTGASYKVFVTPHKVRNNGDIVNGNKLTNIQTVLRYKSGRRNMLDLSAGNYQSYKDPYINTDSIKVSFPNEYGDCLGVSFLKPMINAAASRYDGVNSVKYGRLDSLYYNPVSAGVINQPYQSATYILYGERKPLVLDTPQVSGGGGVVVIGVGTSTGTGTTNPLATTGVRQRGNGVLYNWYYWLPNRYDSSGDYDSRKAMLRHYDNSIFNSIAGDNGKNALWYTASQVTKSVPSVGPVEDTNALGIYSSIFVEPVTKKVMHVTANGRFGQTWVETFEDMQQLRKYNGITDFIYSPFQTNMSTSPTAGSPVYEVFNKNQGSFTLDNTQAHTGLFSLHTSGSVTVTLDAKKSAATIGYYYNRFNFNLDSNTRMFTCEVWVKGGSSAPTIACNAPAKSLVAVSNTIDGWTLYRTEVKIFDNKTVSFVLPGGQNYDDIRLYPSASNVKAYVYHPFKAHLMAVLDENNYATYYEYNNRNNLVRLKKETEKGVITITENIKNFRKSQ